MGVDLFDALADLLFKETTTFGLRYETKHRVKLAREMKAVKTPWGEVKVKIGRFKGEVVSAHPEYEDCKRAADAAGVPVGEVREAALGAVAAGGGRRRSTGRKVKR